jgi:hypothetical protein
MNTRGTRALTNRRIWSRSIVALACAWSIAAAPNALAGTTNPNPPPSPAPNPVTFPQLPTLAGLQCDGQMTNAINTANDVGLAANATSAAANVAITAAQSTLNGVAAGSFTALGVGLAGTVAYGVAPAPTAGGIPFSLDAAAAAGVLAGDTFASTLVYGANIVNAGANVAGVASQITAQTFTDAQSDLPKCDSTSIGTQTINVGQGNSALNVTGESTFAGNLYVTNNGADNGNVGEPVPCVPGNLRRRRGHHARQ